MDHFEINNQWVSLDELEKVLSSNQKVTLGKDARNTIERGFQFLQGKINQEGASFYGINTGFGSLCDTVISSNELMQLQVNLIRSHACGFGAEIPETLVKRMLLLKAIALAKGYSGVQVATVERLIYFYNNDILPVVFEQGSLGASGDLAPWPTFVCP